MFVVNQKFACGHWTEVCLPGAARLAAVYGRLLAAVPCPRCLARKSALATVRAILDEPRLRSDWQHPGQAA